ncbi:LacI family DNA-binding transcriptional regulator [Brevundimonas subvibrioides]|uniref:Transcriptional regulator, LacI family n=1 Tax=Brevundimonas subvibrioides (strain ATCC 15264 / DSM 4735 / LMG 14903 / NBRC 16000 / CB 81) TaxID=633149 RepID=D9QNL2_BRESC|nr:LacI family DNA-binding transcriptional regulator [Brevundimonas subvibrioides]ADL02247.1 transcriptional regulator, LacI family [Brevundimonas subvibrioides ATCC 15264]
MTDDDRKPTIGDVARLAGVSPMTVSRVINDSSRVRPETRARVEAVIADIGYAPDPAARILARAGAGRIGLLYANPSNAYLAEVLAGALSGARAAGLLLMIEPSQAGDPVAERLAVSRLVAGGAQGLIVPPPLGESPATLEAIARAGLRAVALAAPGRGEGVVSLRIDDRAAAGEMVGHLLALGHRHIGFIEGRGDQSASAERRAGAEQAVATVPDARLIVEAGDFTYRSGLEAARRLLTQRPRPTALFASNDDMAAGALAAVHGAGLDAPGDVSVAGFDDTYVAASSWPTLTTIRQPAADMAHEAAIRLARPGETPGSVPHSLIVRDSTGPAPH